MADFEPHQSPPPPVPDSPGSSQLITRYRRLSHDLLQCRLTAAELHGLEEARQTQLPARSDDPDLEPRPSLRLPLIPKLLTEYILRLRTWERECGLWDDVEDQSWIEKLNAPNPLHPLVDNAFAQLEADISSARESWLEDAADVRDETWQSTALQSCRAIRGAVYQLVELQPLIQMFRASLPRGEGPLAALKREIRRIRSRIVAPPPILLRSSGVRNIAEETHRRDETAVDSLWTDFVAIWKYAPLWLPGPNWVKLWRREGLTPFTILTATSLQLALCFVHCIALVGLPFFIIFPPLFLVGYLLAGGLLHAVICDSLNPRGPLVLATSTIGCTQEPSQSRHEAWIFIGGIGVNGPLLQARLDRLSLTFGRKIEAMPSRTSGIILDFLHACWLRAFSARTPNTNDNRNALQLVSDRISDPNISKLVIIAHSTGAIHASYVLDRLLEQDPYDVLSKIEIYTFGAFCKQFHNPWKNIVDEAASLGTPTVLTDLEEPHRPNQYKRVRVIPHIEHYASFQDPFARMGVLSSRNLPSIQGVVFEMPKISNEQEAENRRGQYFLNASYLDVLFPMDENRVVQAAAVPSSEQGHELLPAQSQVILPEQAHIASSPGQARLEKSSEAYTRPTLAGRDDEEIHSRLGRYLGGKQPGHDSTIFMSESSQHPKVDPDQAGPVLLVQPEGPGRPRRRLSPGYDKR